MKQCIIFDIDGTVANLEHRRHFVSGKKKDWPAFMRYLHLDEPIVQTIYMNRLLKFRGDGFPIFMCSGRSENERLVTENWLAANGVVYDKMYMRGAGDYRADHIIKRELLAQIRAEGFEPWVIFDDRPSVVSMWREEGLFVFQCDPNPSMTNHEQYVFHEKLAYPLTIMVGPSGAGKTTFLAASGATYRNEVISSDAIRENICGNFQDQSQNERVFAAMHELALCRLKLGLPVILDATHVRRADRVKAASLVPVDVPVQYIVIDRPLKEKISSGGWRTGVSVKGKPLIEFHDQVFNSNLKDILKGDDLPNVTVTDVRGK